MPYAGQLQQEFADAGVQIIALNAKERGRGDPRAYVESLGFPTVAIADADAIAARYGVEYIPGLMVVDGDGMLVYQRGCTVARAGCLRRVLTGPRSRPCSGPRLAIRLLP